MNEPSFAECSENAETKRGLHAYGGTLITESRKA